MFLAGCNNDRFQSYSFRTDCMRLMLMVSGVLLATGYVGAQSQNMDRPRLADEKIVLHTIAGDIVLGLYPDVAPQHVAQLIQCVEGGIFDGTHFYRLHPNFVLQTSTAWDRLTPLDAAQTAIVHTIPAEFSNRRHVRGVLSMAREDGKPDSGETSFSILLGEAPHLDREYTVFGELLDGWDVVDEFLKVPQDSPYHPAVRLTIESANISRAPLGELIAQRRVATPVSIPVEIAAAAQEKKTLDEPWTAAVTPLMNVAIVGLLIVTALNAIVCLTMWYTPSFRFSLSLLLISTLVGYVFFIMLATPAGRREPLIGLGLLSGMIAQFKLMSLFDRCERPQKPASNAQPMPQ